MDGARHRCAWRTLHKPYPEPGDAQNNDQSCKPVYVLEKVIPQVPERIEPGDASFNVCKIAGRLFKHLIVPSIYDPVQPYAPTSGFETESAANNIPERRRNFCQGMPHPGSSMILDGKSDLKPSKDSTVTSSLYSPFPVVLLMSISMR